MTPPIDESKLERFLRPMSKKEGDESERSLECFGFGRIAERRAVWMRLAMKDFVSISCFDIAT